MSHEIELWSHQEAALLDMRDGCVLWGGVGSGKTRTALAYALKRHPGKKIVVITTAKKRDSGDWEDEARGLNIPYDQIFVDSWNNIKKWVDVEGCFVILDEQRLVGTGAWVKAFYQIAKHNKWILLSGTPGDTWLDYAPVFIANGFYRNITEFRNMHVVYKNFGGFPQVSKYINEGILMRRRKLILVEMPFIRHTTRHLTVVDCEWDRDILDTVWKRRWNVYEDRPLKDAGELFRVGRKVVGLHESRIEAIRDLMGQHKRLIVFYNFDYELEILRKLIWEPSISGNLREWNGHKHEDIPDSESWIYLVQYVAGAEGWNCVTTNAVCFYSLTYSYKIFEQAQGRIDRMNTPFEDLFYYVLMSKSIVDKAVWRALSAKKDFNTRGYSV